MKISPGDYDVSSKKKNNNNREKIIICIRSYVETEDINKTSQI